MKEMSRTEHMLLSAWGERWKEVTLAMFTVYLDDSGTAPSHRVACSSALVIPAARICALNNELDSLKRKEGFECFHTSECVAANPKSEFAGWDEAKQRRVLGRVRQIAKKFAPVAFSFSVNKHHYDSMVPDELRQHVGNHFTWSVRSMIAALDRWAEITGMATPFEYVYDWIDPKSQKAARYEIDTVMAQAEELGSAAGKAGRYTNYSFRRRQDIPALQCVDALAWTCYQQSLFIHCGIPRRPIALESWKDYARYLRGEWLGAMYMTREQLQDWVDREADGKSLARFKEWATKNKNGKSKTT